MPCCRKTQGFFFAQTVNWYPTLKFAKLHAKFKAYIGSRQYADPHLHNASVSLSIPGHSLTQSKPAHVGDFVLGASFPAWQFQEVLPMKIFWRYYVKLATFVLVSCIGVSAVAGQQCRSVTETGVFFVSAVLGKNDEDGVIKLIQAVQSARTQEDAVQLLVEQATREFPGYRVLTTLASSAADLKLPPCKVTSSATFI